MVLLSANNCSEIHRDSPSVLTVKNGGTRPGVPPKYSQIRVLAVAARGFREGVELRLRLPLPYLKRMIFTLRKHFENFFGEFLRMVGDEHMGVVLEGGRTEIQLHRNRQERRCHAQDHHLQNDKGTKEPSPCQLCSSVVNW